jgi:hypothetical protein
MRRLLLLFALAFTAVGCEDPTTFEEEIAGTYHLISIDGDALPITFRNDSVRIEITASEILMGINGVYREIDTFRTTRAAGVTTQVDTFTAVWTVNATNQITLTTQTSQGPLSILGVWNGTNTLTFDVAGFPWVFRR